MRDVVEEPHLFFGERKIHKEEDEMRHGNIHHRHHQQQQQQHHPQRRDALKHRNAFVSSSAGGEGGTRGGEESNATGRTVRVGPREPEQRTSTSTTNEEGEDEDGTQNESEGVVYRYLQIAFIVFLITCSVAFAEFIYERLLFEHSEIKEHPHGKTLFIGSVVVVCCWTMLVVVVVLSY